VPGEPAIRWSRAFNAIALRHREILIIDNVQNQDCAYRLLSASARALPGTWLYPPDSTSEPLTGMRCNLVAIAYVVLARMEIGLLRPD
jgi:hypothetical protein